MQRDREDSENTVLSPEGEEGAFQNFLSWPLFPNQHMESGGRGGRKGLWGSDFPDSSLQC